MILKTRLIRAVGSLLVMLILVGFMFSGCSDEEEFQPINDEVAKVVIAPDTAFIAVGDVLEFSVLALTSTGDTIDPADFEITWEWWSSDIQVFTVDQDGKATGENPGEAFCFMEYHIPYSAQNVSKTLARIAGENALKGFVGRDSAVVHVF